jgi:hypothetical protein
MSWGAIAAAVIGAAGSVGGALLSKKGDNSIGSTVTGPTQQAKQYWLNQLNESYGIQSGAKNPTELPVFKQMANQYNTQSDKGMDQLVQMLGQKGILGGAAGGAIGNAELAQKEGLLKMIQSMYSRADERGNVAAGQLGSRSRQQLPQQTPPTGTPDSTGLWKMMFEMMNKNNTQISPNAGSGVAGIDWNQGGYGNWMPPSGSTWG